MLSMSINTNSNGRFHCCFTERSRGVGEGGENTNSTTKSLLEIDLGMLK